MSIKIIGVSGDTAHTIMKKEILSLTGIYDDEIADYGGMLELGREKKDILKKKDMNGLTSIIKKEEPLLSRARELEKKRRGVYKIILSGKETPEKWMHKLPAEIQAPLKKKRDKLLKIINELNKVNDINSALISQSMELIEYALKTLTQIRNKTSAYDSVGNPYRKDKVVESTIFDRKS